MRYLCVGGAGFICSHLVDKLLVEGHEVVVVDKSMENIKKNLFQHKNNKKLMILNKDVLGLLGGVFDKANPFDVVFHLSALPSVQGSIGEPYATNEQNVTATLKLLSLCHLYGVKRFIFASSCSVYGDSDASVLSESLPTNPQSPYALQKVIGEQYCKLFYELYGLETISLRYFNVFGTRQSDKGEYSSLIPNTIWSVRNYNPPTIYGSGNQTRDFISVKDVVDATITASKVTNKSCFGEAFNIGSGKSKSVNEIVALFQKMGGKTYEPIYFEERKEPLHAKADLIKTEVRLGWKPKTVVEDELKLLWKEY